MIDLLEDKTGKDVLQDLVQNSKEDYAALSKEEKEDLILEFEKVKATMAKGFCSSAWSHVNDVTKTVEVLENEVMPCVSPDIFGLKHSRLLICEAALV